MKSATIITRAKSDQLQEVTAGEMTAASGGGMYVGEHGFALTYGSFTIGLTTSGWVLCLPFVGCNGGAW